MRASSYLIAAPLSGGRCHVLMHGLYGSVDKVASSYAEALLERRGDVIDTSSWDPAVVEHLERRGYLTGLSAEKERRHPRPRRRGAPRPRPGPPPGELRAHPVVRVQPALLLLLPIARDARGYDVFSASMSDAQIDAIFAVIDELSEPGAVAHRLGMADRDAHPLDCAGDHTPDLTLFGGEPLRAVLVPTVAAILDRARTRGLRVGAITNGVELDAYADLLGPHGVAEVQVTLDGPATCTTAGASDPGSPRRSTASPRT